MNNKNIILAGVVAIGIYLFSQAKKIPFITGVQRRPSATTLTVRQRTAQKIAQKIAQKVAQKRVAPVNIYEYMRERARMNKAIPIRSKKIARKIPSVGTSAARRRVAQKIEETRNRKIREQKAAATKVWIENARKNKAQKAAATKVWIENARKNKAQKAAAPWKAPLVWSPKPKFRVITPSDILRNLAKKDMARKKAEQQKTAQKTTSITPSARRKKRLGALYGPHWHDIWIQRQKRR